MGINIFGSVKEALFGKKNAEASAAENSIKAFFVLEGTNPDGDYVFVSKNEMPGRSVLCSDGSFYFVQMNDPNDKDSLDESDRRTFFAVRFFVNKEELDLLKRDIVTREEETEQLLKRKKDLETIIENLRKENERLAAHQQMSMESLEDSVKQNPVTVETVTAISNMDYPPDVAIGLLNDARTIFLDYAVTGVNEQQEKELADILTTAFAKNVPKAQMPVIAGMYMQDQKTGDAETYLRLAVFASCVGVIQEHASEMRSVPNKKELNREFMQSCAEKLRGFVGDDDYASLLYSERYTILEEQIAPLKQEYSDSIDAIIQQNSPNL